jgi:protein SCO1/2
VRILLPLVVLAVVAAGCGSAGSSSPASTTAPAAASRFLGAELTPPRAAPPIVLHDAAGAPVTLAAQRGRYTLVTFLYVHCPDVCPLIAQNLNVALRELGPARSRVRVIAVSVDPKGDTPAAVRRYIRTKRLLPQFRYLIGTPAELRRTWAAWHVASVRESPELVDHVAYTALVDPSGKQRVLYDAQIKAPEVLHDLRELMRSRA